MEFVSLLRQIDWAVFIAVFLSSVLVGILVHELAHIILIGGVSTITVNIGDPEHFIEICCVRGDEIFLEQISYLLQFFSMVFWTLAFRKTYIKRFRYPKTGE